MVISRSFHYEKKCYDGIMLEAARIIFLYVVPIFICLTLIGFIVQIAYQRMQSKEKEQDEIAKKEQDETGQS
jgi:hypothetical protein